LISVRISTRSFASRLLSGSSNRNTSRVAHDRPAHRDALTLSTRQLAGLTIEQMLDLQQLGSPVYRRFALLGVGTFRGSRCPKPMFRRTGMFG
jgi:hypothetical protein